jgi:hypothetical protein
MTEEYQIKLEERTEKIQKELHELIDNAKERAVDGKVNYQDYVTVFLIDKIAQLELKLLDNQV